MSRYLIAIVLLLSACATTFTLVKPGRVAVVDGYSVQPSIEWSSWKVNNDQVWTVDGFALQSLRFSRGIHEGESIFKTPGKKPRAFFRPSMTETEIADLLVDELSLLGAKNVEITSLRPQKFGSMDGFGLDIDYSKDDGLESRALVSGAVLESKLYLIMYFGPRQQYFERHLDEVKAIMNSIELGSEVRG